MPQAPVIYFDVDDTLIRSASTKRIPIPAAIATVRALKLSGARLFLWSTGGAEYARTTAVELGLVECFEAFLPKPNAIVDDQAITEWRDFLYFLPGQEVILK
jgi:predicted HAD superfamily phosphohydrolase YqeG